VLPVRKLTDDEAARCSDMSAAEVHGVKEVVTLLPGSMAMHFPAFWAGSIREAETTVFPKIYEKPGR
jgi:hypothetical protein